LDTFSYLSVLTSIILALGIARLLYGLGRLLQGRGRITLYWVHLLWALNLFLFLVLNWWILYRWNVQQEWTFFLFLFVLLSPTIAYLLTVLLFPEPMDDGLDLRQHYYANHRAFFTLGALLPLIDALDTYLKGREHFHAQGPLYVFFLGTVFLLMIFASRTDRSWYHALFAIFFFLYLLAFIAINLRVLS
jgi:hypothetical protein